MSINGIAAMQRDSPLNAILELVSLPKDIALDEAFQAAEASVSFEAHLEFKERLLAAGTEDAMAYHFEAIARTGNADLREVLATFFHWWGKPATGYLLARLQTESEPLLIGIGLQILGRMRASGTLTLARRHLHHSDDFVREKACIVLGWCGQAADVPRLAALQTEDPCVAVRKWAATQQAHIHDRLKGVEPKVVANLKKAIECEADPEVLAMNIFATEMALGRRFGLRQSDNGEYDPASLSEPRRKALVALKNRIGRLHSC